VRSIRKGNAMQIKPIGLVIAAAGLLWLGSMAWLTGYQQGYDEGATTAWDDARDALQVEAERSAERSPLAELTSTGH
jgi:hypothetical protein